MSSHGQLFGVSGRPTSNTDFNLKLMLLTLMESGRLHFFPKEKSIN